MDKDTNTIALYSKGGRLYVKPTDILASEKGKQVLNRFKESSIYESIHQKQKPFSAA